MSNLFGIAQKYDYLVSYLLEASEKDLRKLLHRYYDLKAKPTYL